MKVTAEINDMVIVHWFDAASASEWRDREADKKVKLSAILTMGFFNGVHEDRGLQYLSIFASKDEETGYSNIHSIPLNCVTDIKILRVGKSAFFPDKDAFISKEKGGIVKKVKTNPRRSSK